MAVNDDDINSVVCKLKSLTTEEQECIFCLVRNLADNNEQFREKFLELAKETW